MPAQMQQVPANSARTLGHFNDVLLLHGITLTGTLQSGYPSDFFKTVNLLNTKTEVQLLN